MPDPYPHYFNRHGKAFTDRLFGVRRRAATRQNAFDPLCSTSGIEHWLTPPRSPSTNGMVERFNGRIKDVTMFDQAKIWGRRCTACLLSTSDAADDLHISDPRGPRIINKNINNYN